jgi:thioredoxin reductase
MAAVLVSAAHLNLIVNTMIVAILGAGPAGMSCANACLSFGLTPIVLEQSGEIGGIQLGNFHPNLWLIGEPEETGREMSERMARHFSALPLTCLRHARVTTVQGTAGHFTLSLDTSAGKQSLLADAIVLATGTYPRATPELTALAEQSERVIIGPLSETIRDDIRQARVLILGGGDNALDHALFLAERDNQIRVCTRGRFSARQPFQDTCQANPNIELRDNCTPDTLQIDSDENRIIAAWGAIKVRYDWLLAMFGYLPNTSVLTRFAPELRPVLNASGHILTDVWQRTSVAGIYAAGDVTETPQPSVPTALAQGLVAARAAERDAEQTHSAILSRVK